jgi:hypothetical protein
MYRRIALVIGLLFTLLSLVALPAAAASSSHAAPRLVQNLGLGDSLARFHTWLGGIWPQIGCTGNPDGATNCGSNVITPPSTQGHGHAADDDIFPFSSAAAH